MIARLEYQLEETEGKLSSFHLDNIKEAANKLEHCYQSQIAPVYNNFIEISSKMDAVEIRKKMDRGSKILQHIIWTVNNTVNNKKTSLCDDETC